MEKKQSRSKRISKTTSIPAAPREQSGAHLLSPVLLVAVILLVPLTCKVSICKPSKNLESLVLVAPLKAQSLCSRTAMLFLGTIYKMKCAFKPICCFGKKQTEQWLVSERNTRFAIRPNCQTWCPARNNHVCVAPGKIAWRQTAVPAHLSSAPHSRSACRGRASPSPSVNQSLTTR